MIESKTLWNEAGKSGIALGGVSLVYMAVNFLFSSAPQIATTAGYILNTFLWAVKLWLCLWLLKVFMTRFSNDYPEADNSDTFKFGMATAFLSALIYSGGYLAWVTLVQPDMFSDIIASAEKSMEALFTEEMMEQMEELIPKMPTISFFANLLWCSMFGTFISAIYSRSIPSANPFKNRRNPDGE